MVYICPRCGGSGVIAILHRKGYGSIERGICPCVKRMKKIKL
jgi:hypothetical protein